MFGFLFGLFGLDWFNKMLVSDMENVDTAGNVMVNSVNDDVYKALYSFIKIYEGFEPKAYNLGDGKITIGYGSTNWLSPSGSVIRPVKMGETISEVVAEQQVKYYFVKVVPALNQYMAINNIVVSQYYLAALLNFCYMSGPGFLSWASVRSSMLQVNRNQIRSSVALQMRKDIVQTYKSLRTNATERQRYGANKLFKWQIYGLGWSRRIQAAADLIEGKLKKKSYYDATIKKAF